MRAYCLRVGVGEGLVRPVGLVVGDMRGLVPGLAVGDIIGDIVGDIIGDIVGEGEAILDAPPPAVAVGEGELDVTVPVFSPQAPMKRAKLSNPAAAR